MTETSRCKTPGSPHRLRLDPTVSPRSVGTRPVVATSRGVRSATERMPRGCLAWLWLTMCLWAGLEKNSVDSQPSRVSLAPTRMAVDACERRLSPRAAAQHTVLVVDDEPLMRLFVMRALRGAGYDTIEAASAEEALELLTADDGGISLLVSDVQLPGISGSQLVEQARDL